MRSWFIVLMCAFATVAIAGQDAPPSVATSSAPVAAKGKMLLGADGGRLAPVYRVAADGSAQIILDGKLITVPASTLSTVSGKLTTSLTKSAVLALP
jgi:hypothetical protein